MVCLDLAVSCRAVRAAFDVRIVWTSGPHEVRE